MRIHFEESTGKLEEGRRRVCIVIGYLENEVDGTLWQGCIYTLMQHASSISIGVGEKA